MDQAPDAVPAVRADDDEPDVAVCRDLADAPGGECFERQRLALDACLGCGVLHCLENLLDTLVLNLPHLGDDLAVAVVAVDRDRVVLDADREQRHAEMLCEVDRLARCGLGGRGSVGGQHDRFHLAPPSVMAPLSLCAGAG